jgi:hypothetical protein
VEGIDMNKYMIGSRALRMTFLAMAIAVWLGIWLTGFGVAHWVLYLPAVFLTFAGITGFCPGLIVNKFLLQEE